MPISGKSIIKKLRKVGWRVIGQTGSHVKLANKNKRTIIPIHGNRDLPIGTIKSIEKQTGEKLI